MKKVDLQEIVRYAYYEKLECAGIETIARLTCPEHTDVKDYVLELQDFAYDTYNYIMSRPASYHDGALWLALQHTLNYTMKEDEE